MSPKYEKSIEMSREEEGSYHRREVEHLPQQTNRPSYTTHTSYQVVPSKSKPIVSSNSSKKNQESSDEDNFEEWTTSKRKVNHKTRQVETRVSRQLLVEDGKVIADSGPQVTTRIKEDNKVEECEKEKQPKNKSKFEAIENAPEGESKGRVLGEKKEIQRVSREVREESMQYHDERFKELTGHDVHRRAIQAPHELITITDKDAKAPPRGKMVHYSNKGKKYQDTDEILEVAKLAIDGSITKEVKRTKHHEEFSDTEHPDETGEAEALRDAPTVTRSSRRHVDYVNDFDDTNTPSCSSDEEVSHPVRGHNLSPEGRHKSRHSSSKLQGAGSSMRRRSKENEAFPRYEIDPLLNSLRDEDFRPATSDYHYKSTSGGVRQVPLERKERVDLSDNEHSYRNSGHRQHELTRQRSISPTPVEIPEEYRVNRQRLMSSKGGSKSSSLVAGSKPRERSFSPTNKSHLSHKSSKSHRSQQEDASVQAHLTDEEEERKSLRSSSSGEINSHKNKTRHLQRQSTNNSSRNYYFGETRHRANSISSTSSDSLSDPKERMRKKGNRSRDSGFKSPHSMQRTATPISTGSGQQNYSVSNKQKKDQQQQQQRDRGTISPTLTTGSAGQRSVKTTTTTLSAKLAEREPERPNRTKNRSETKTNRKVESSSSGKQQHSNKRQHHNIERLDGKQEDGLTNRSADSISLASLGPGATTIKVPYRHSNGMSTGTVIPIRREPIASEKRTQTTDHVKAKTELHEGINNLRKRMDDISSQASLSFNREEETKPEHFNYKTFIANVQPAPMVPKQQVVDTYNVRVIDHNSPFHEPKPIKSVSELSNSIARLELLSSELDSLAVDKKNRKINVNLNTTTNGNNNELYLVNDKHRAIPIVTDDTLSIEDDRHSVVSSCSLQSTRTYNVKAGKIYNRPCLEDELSDEKDFPVEVQNLEFNDDEKKPAAWVFDLRDGSSTAIIAPPKPEGPKLPDAKTEDLAVSRGGRSYYLELIENGKKETERQRPSSVDSLYSRSNSHSTLGGSHFSSRQVAASRPAPAQVKETLRKPRQMMPAKVIGLTKSKIASSSLMNVHQANPINKTQSRQLPAAKAPSLDTKRSKSSSCLVSTTKPSKYSIYGGLKSSKDDNKPVPRLSYSRAIGPKSQRQIDNQPKPSRYLKMK